MDFINLLTVQKRKFNLLIYKTLHIKYKRKEQNYN